MLKCLSSVVSIASYLSRKIPSPSLSKENVSRSRIFVRKTNEYYDTGFHIFRVSLHFQKEYRFDMCRYVCCDNVMFRSECFLRSLFWRSPEWVFFLFCALYQIYLTIIFAVFFYIHEMAIVYYFVRHIRYPTEKIMLGNKASTVYFKRYWLHVL